LSDWISGLTFQRRTICVIQCDLEKHSDWFYACVREGRGAEATLAKQDLAERIQAGIRDLQLIKVFWAGDGGAFAAPEIPGEQVVNGARKMLAAFKEWQGRYGELHLEKLGLRVSCHQCAVFCGADPAFWASEELNVFFKNEREISHANTVSITQKIFEDVGQLAGDFRDYRYEAKVKGSDRGTWTIYFDRRSAEGVQKQTRGTVQRFADALGTGRTEGMNCESEKFAIGDSVVLHMSPSSTESIHVELLRAPDEQFQALADKLPNWKTEEEKVLKEISLEQDARKKADLTKASPLELLLPLSDFPLARIKYSPIKYSRVRSFMTLLKGPSELWRTIATGGVDYVRGMALRPGILVAHMVVLAKDEVLGDCVLLGQRAQRIPDSIGFQQGDWSASIEEQFKLEDVLIGQTILRGLQEEILAEQADNASNAVVGLFLEKRILNLAAAAICRTTLTFNTIVEKLWPRSVDQTEHTQFVALPLNKELLLGCIKENRFTEGARAQCRRVNEAVWRATTKWDFHPSTAFRLALALWAADHI